MQNKGVAFEEMFAYTARFRMIVAFLTLSETWKSVVYEMDTK